jgi:hypothetical protein
MRASRVIPALAVLVLGCGGTTLVVNSDTSWAGSVAGYGTISGQGSAEYDIESGSGSCWTVSKLTEAGTLRVYAKQSEWFGIGEEVGGEAATTSPLGSVTGCAP